MDSLHVSVPPYNMWNIGWVDVVDFLDSQRIDLDLHILHVGCQTDAHIDDHRTFDYFFHIEYSRYSTQLHSSDRLPGNFVDFLSLGGSW